VILAALRFANTAAEGASTPTNTVPGASGCDAAISPARKRRPKRGESTGARIMIVSARRTGKVGYM
jgi:hypothetical protein